jgi:MFS family permease
MAKWGALVILSLAQFLMVLDAAVMNVSISQLVEDFDTDVTTIQAVITLYSLVMAALMMVGGKLGDIWGRRRAFRIGLVIYGIGSGLTAAAWSVPSLTLGWSILEGIGAALVMPALAALAAANYEGRDRATAYGALGGVAGAGIAVGPILGGWVTTELTWRVVFAGEVVLAIVILLGSRLLSRAPADEPRPQLDVVGGILNALGLGLIVFGILKASSWGWLFPKNSPVEPFGFSLAPFLMVVGAICLVAFRSWERRREELDRTPLVHLALLGKRHLRAGLVALLNQNTILMGIFFVVPLYLQVVQGYDALDTGIAMLPVSVTMLIAAMLGSRLSAGGNPKRIVRGGLLIVLIAVGILLATIDAEIETTDFAIAMAVLGAGLGLLSSQLGNVVQSSVGFRERSEAGGLQYTSQQLGSALGTALIGAVVLSGLISGFESNVTGDPAIAEPVKEQVSIAVTGDVSFVASDQVAAAAAEAGVDEPTTQSLVEHYEDSQLLALKTGLLVAGFIVIAAFFAAGGLPTRLEEEPEPQ